LSTLASTRCALEEDEPQPDLRRAALALLGVMDADRTEA
jgi:hypothetical protein